MTSLSLFDCIDDLREIQKRIDAGADVNAQDENGKTPLMYARYAGVIHELVSSGARINVTDRNGKTALQYAIKEKSRNVINALIVDGAELTKEVLVELNKMKPCLNKYGTWLLMYCNNKDIVEVFIEIIKAQCIKAQCDVKKVINKLDEFGRTVLFYCKNTDIVKLLIENKADITVTDKDGATPLMFCGDKDIPVDISKVLIEKVRQDSDCGEIAVKKFINKTDKFGRTALFYCENKDVAQLLIDNSADVNATDNNGATPLMLCRNEDIAELLIKQGAKVAAKDKDGWTALHWSKSKQIDSVLRDNGAVDDERHRLNAVIRDSIHSLFDSDHDILRHWTLIQQIASEKGIEVWWHGELLGHLQRKDCIPSFHKDLVVFSEYNDIDLLISFGEGPWNKVLPNRSSGKYIPVELKMIRENFSTDSIKKSFFEYGDSKKKFLYADSVDMYKNKKCIREPYGLLVAMVTGICDYNTYKDLINMTRHFHPKEIPSGALKLILDEEIQIKRKQIVEKEENGGLGEENDEYIKNARAHQFVWAVIPKILD